MLIFLLILILLLLPSIQFSCDLKEIEVIDNLLNQYQDGDLIIGGLLTIDKGVLNVPFQDEYLSRMICGGPDLQGFLHSLIFLFAIDNINKNPDILPNITLGYHLYDSCLDVRVAVQRVLHLLSGPDKMIPNYSCRSHGQLAGIIGDHHSSTTIPAAQILGLYGYTQISYGATDHSLSDRRLYPHVFRTVQSHHVHNMVITKLLAHFGWTWVGIIVSDDDAGENELQILTKYMKEHGICAAFTIKLKNKNVLYDKRTLDILQDPQVSVIIMCGTYSGYGNELIGKYGFVFMDKTFIFPPSWASGSIFTDYQYTELNGSLAVEISSQSFPGMEDFVKNYRKFPNIYNNIMNQICYGNLELIERNDNKDSINITYEYKYSVMHTRPSLRNRLSSGVTPRLYYAVEILAKALHEMFLYIKDKYQENSITGLIQHAQELQRYIQRMKSSQDPMRPSYYFTDQGEAEHPYKIINHFYPFIYEDINYRKCQVEVGNFTPWVVSGKKLYINKQMITWKHTQEVRREAPNHVVVKRYKSHRVHLWSSEVQPIRKDTCVVYI